MTKYRSYVTMSRKRKKDSVLSVRWAKVRWAKVRPFVRVAVRWTISPALLMNSMRTLDPSLFVKNLFKRLTCNIGQNIGIYPDIKIVGFFGLATYKLEQNTDPCRFLIAVYITYCLPNVLLHIYNRNLYLIILWTMYT